MLAYAATDHDYYCETHNYWVPPSKGGGCVEYDTWADFIQEFMPNGKYEDHYNHIFRFDLMNKCDPETEEPTGGLELQMFMIHQRKGDFLAIMVAEITQEDMPSVDKFLEARWQYIKKPVAGVFLPLNGRMIQMTIRIGCSYLALEILAIAFIVLKLIGLIDWSWLWVLAPVWAPIALLCVGNFICWAAVKFMERND